MAHSSKKSKSSRKMSRKHSKKSASHKMSRKVSRKHSKKSASRKMSRKQAKCPAGQARIRGFTKSTGVKVKGHCSRPKGRKSPKKRASGSRKMAFEYMDMGDMGFEGDY
jgi:hypothetical protein